MARQFHANGLDRKTLAKSAKTFRRFEAERPNQIWQSDILYGPYLPDPNQPAKNKRTYLVAFIDDFSRLVPHTEFYWDEKFPTLENTFKIAMLKRGLPETIHVDNGKVYHARRLDAVCAALGIRKISCQPYSPEGKGKVERFFRTIRENFLEEPESRNVQTLPELNKLFWAWLEVDYQQRVHSTTEVAPLTRWRDHIGNFLRTVGEKELVELFLWQVNRTVNKVGLVAVQGLEFEVEAMLHNRKVEVRYNPFDLSAVHIYYQGRFFQKALPAKISRWNLAAKALFLSVQLQALFTRLRAFLARRGMALITGEVGSGKSTAIRGFAEALEKTQYDWVYIDDPTVGLRGMWNSIATQLNLNTRFFKWQLMPALKNAMEKNLLQQNTVSVIFRSIYREMLAACCQPLVLWLQKVAIFSDSSLIL